MALDGNALAGPLAGIYAFDAPSARACCAACGVAELLARALVFATAMGVVARCRNCEAVLLTVVDRPDGTSVSARGITWLRPGP